MVQHRFRFDPFRDFAEETVGEIVNHLNLIVVQPGLEEKPLTTGSTSTGPETSMA